MKGPQNQAERNQEPKVVDMNSVSFWELLQARLETIAQALEANLCNRPKHINHIPVGHFSMNLSETSRGSSQLTGEQGQRKVNKVEAGPSVLANPVTESSNLCNNINQVNPKLLSLSKNLKGWKKIQFGVFVRMIKYGVYGL